MKFNIFSDLRKPGLVPGKSLSLSENYEFCCRETLITHKYHSLDEEKEKYVVQTRSQRQVEYNYLKYMVQGRDWILIRYQKNNHSQ